MNHEKHPDTVVPPYRAGEKHEKIIYRNESYQIQGAIFEVYKILGPGFLEAVYQECLEKKLTLRKIPFKNQVDIRLSYKNIPLNQTYRADFICFDLIIIGIKALTKISGIYRAQLLNYLKATMLKLGLLVNFSSYPKATIDRIIL